MDNHKSENAWEYFLKLKKMDIKTPFFESFYFSDNEKWANLLLELVLKGTKKATSSCLKAYEIENSRIPQPGDYSLVTDWQLIPRCVIKTSKVTILPYKNMTYKICKREGEDRTLQTWKENHWEAFTKEGHELGFSFTEANEIVFEDFTVEYIFNSEEISKF
jgi:uncharacterized protein YhfF